MKIKVGVEEYEVPDVRKCTYCRFWIITSAVPRCRIFNRMTVHAWKPCQPCMTARQQSKEPPRCTEGGK